VTKNRQASDIVAEVPDDSDLGLGSMASLLGKLASTSTEELLVRGTVIDEQFEIERVLGHGAMGVVYLARDRRLERDVAIKVAREKSPTAITRSSREAVALAKLSHPNVVTVHQVGELDGRVYVAMEYVAGKTARVWVEGKTPREIIALYLAVGDGLAAAHAAGLVHRDFKPDNVLVGDDGRARVADFGLARTPTRGELAKDTGGETNAAGTPAYMPPEQASGGLVDARSDQFSFCASMWEALYGTRDFEKPQAPPRSGVARHVEIALRRGLSRAPKDRWPAMPELLAELRRDPGRTTRVAMMVIAPAIVVGAISFGISMRGADAVDPCGEGEERMARVWSPAVAGVVRAVLAPTGSTPWAVRNAEDVLEGVRRWTASWASKHREVCRARAWTPELRNRGMACLARREHTLVAAVDRSRSVSAEVATKLLADLPAAEPCGDPAYLESVVPTPKNPVVGGAVAARLLEIDRVRALELSGDVEGARAAAEALANTPVDDAHATAHLAFARAKLMHSANESERALDGLRAAYFAGRSIGDRVLAVNAAVTVVLALVGLTRDADAKHWGRLAEVEVETIADPQLQSRTLQALSILASVTDEPDRGLALAERAVEQSRSLRALELPNAYMARAKANSLLGRYDQALGDLARARESVSSLHGEVHPLQAEIYTEQSLIEKLLQRTDAAVVSARRSLEIAEQTMGPKSKRASGALGALAIALGGAGQFDEAIEVTGRGLALDRELDGERSYNVASDYNNRAELYVKMKRHEEAIADAQQAITIWNEVLGRRSHEAGIAETNIAFAYRDMGKHEEALVAADRSLQQLAPDILPAHVMRLVRAEGLLARGERAKARAEVEAVSAAFAKSEVPGEYTEMARGLREILGMK
jgi:tetratricopeptide (TPR) repeat protein/predicted Ser/Thr protein kinase